MKATLPDGTVIECTVQEFKEFKKENRENGIKEPEPETPTKHKPVKPIRRKKHIKTEVQQSMYGKVIKIARKQKVSLKQAITEVFGRKSHGGDYKKLRHYFGEAVIQELGNKRTSKIKSVEGVIVGRDMREVRGAFIGKRANELIRAGSDRTTAWHKASDEWNANNKIEPSPKHMIRKQPLKPQTFDEKMTKLANKQQTKFVPPDFPNIWPLHTEAITIFKDMLRNLIANGGQIGFFDCKDHLRLQDEDAIWDGRMWSKFMAQVMFNKIKICEYFMCKDKLLKVEIINGYHYVTYRKK